MNDHQLMLGDCLEKMAEIPTGSVDLVLTDPPYGTTACAWDAVIPFEPMWVAVRRVLKPSGAAVFTSSQPFTSALVMSNPREFRHEWIWEKTAATGFFNAKKAPLRAHESVLVFAGAPPTYRPQKRSGATIKRVNPSYADHGNVYGKAVSVREPYCSTERYPRSVVVFPKDNRMRATHPTQKPVALMEYLIRTYTNEGETVLDFAMGSGTTGVSCVNTDRKFIGIERDPRYFDMASQRLARLI
mgnify:CR=1 FL=1